MGKRRFIEESWRKEPWFRSLCSALKSCKTEEETANLLRDIGTLSELQAWSERLEVARLLSRGLSYRQVSAQTGASTTTVTRVAHFLENGEGGYRKFLHAHRHHRMVSSEQPEQVVQPPEQPLEASEQKSAPLSALQKYLGK